MTDTVVLALRAERRARGVAVEGLSRALLGALDLALASRLAVDAVDRVMASALVEEATRNLVRNAVLERVTVELADSDALDAVVERLLESEELWLVVDAVARSPAVTDAIAQQSVGFADQVAGGVRARSRSADAWIESKVRRVLGRRM